MDKYASKYKADLNATTINKFSNAPSIKYPPKIMTSTIASQGNSTVKVGSNPFVMRPMAASRTGNRSNAKSRGGVSSTLHESHVSKNSFEKTSNDAVNMERIND